MDGTHTKSKRRLAAIIGKKTKGRPRQMMLDWMLADSYRKLKEKT